MLSFKKFDQEVLLEKVYIKTFSSNTYQLII